MTGPERTGNQFSLTAKTMMSRNANTYGAIDSPSMLTARLSRSMMPFGQRAASVATMIDSTTDDHQRVQQQPEGGRHVDGKFVVNARALDGVPRFPCSTLTSQCQYRCQNGWSRPRVWLSAITADGLACSPSIAWACRWAARS